MLQGLVRYGGSGATAEDARAGCARALRCVPHGARLLWVHAYQVCRRSYSYYYHH